MTYIIPTTNAEHLARKLESEKGMKVIFLDKNKDGGRYFPDKEVFVSLRAATEIPKERIVVLHSGMPLPNRGIVELEMILAFLKDNNFWETEVCFTYFAYGMQDHTYHQGEVNSAEDIIKKLLYYYRVRKIHIIDPHFHGREWVNKYPINEVLLFPLLREAVLKDYPEDMLFLTPDAGGQKRTNLTGSSKKRINSFEIDFDHGENFCLNVKDKIVGVVDDIIETGGTMSRFAEKCKECGAKEVIAIASHGVLEEGIERIEHTYSKLYMTNSINHPDANVDITNLLYETIKDNC